MWRSMQVKCSKLLIPKEGAVVENLGRRPRGDKMTEDMMLCEPLIKGSWRTCGQHEGGSVCEACHP